jgi:membrane associated rhomboid family serine protease
VTDTNAAPRDDGTPPDSGDDPLIWIRHAPTQDKIDEWALVLAAIGVPYQVARHTPEPELAAVHAGYLLGVAASKVTAATRALHKYDVESRTPADAAPAAPDRGSNALGIGVGLALIAFAMITGYWESESGSRWFQAGVADASRIRAGEWWRAVTAMTLHADVMHLLGNVAASVIFISAAGRWMGAGVAAAAIVAAGTGANLLTAWTQRGDHLSVGASTATFAGLGLVVGLQVVRRWRGGGAIRRRAWIAAGAGFALLAMLGMGATADVSAHAYGLGLGTLLGVAVGIVDRPSLVLAAGGVPVVDPPPARAQRLLATAAQAALLAITVAAVAAAWTHAWAHG